MKMSYLLVLPISWLFHSCTTQRRPAKRAVYPRQYVAVVRLASPSEGQKGVLYELADSTVVLAPMEWGRPAMKTMLKQQKGTLPSIDSLRSVLPLKTYRYADIDRLTVHRRGSLGKGFLIGAGIGVLATTVSLLVFPDGFSADFSGTRKRSKPDFGDKARLALSSIGVLGGSGLLIGVATAKIINAKKQPIPVAVKKQFRKYTIVEQVNQANLYSGYK